MSEQPELPLEFTDDDGSTYTRVDPGEFAESDEREDVELDDDGADEDDD